MLVGIIHCHVKPEAVEAFKAACIDNARASLKEPGILRFDILQLHDDPTRFTFYEVYRTPDDPARHRETAHFKAWMEATADMFVEPRTPVRYTNIFPTDDDWR